MILPAAAVARGVVDGDEMRPVEGGDSLAVGTATIAVRPTPGHTSGMTTYRVDDHLALTGDTLFLDSVARPDLEDGDDGARAAAEQLYDTLHDRLLTLPNDTLIGPAHFGDAETARDDGAHLATLGSVVDRLPLLSVDKEVFVDRVLANMPPRPANYEEIIAANLGQTTPSAADAFTMELGPNNCAAGE